MENLQALRDNLTVSAPKRELVNPRLSIVIATIHGGESLRDCIASFAQQPHGDEIEMVVAASSRNGAGALQKICVGYPNVRLVHFAERKSIPELRAAGFLNARGDVLAMTEDHCLADEHWIENILRAHASPHLVIGGAVENAATERLIDWAVFFCEYGRYMQPIPPGAAIDLPGPNVSYKRAALEQFRDLLEAGIWEPFWHQRLIDHGVQLINDPSIVIYHRKDFSFRGFLAERFYYARSFAGTRVRNSTSKKRFFLLFAAPGLPPLLLARIFFACGAKVGIGANLSNPLGTFFYSHSAGQSVKRWGMRSERARVLR